MNKTEAMAEAIAAMQRSTIRDVSDPHVGAVLVSGCNSFSQEHMPTGHAEFLLLSGLDEEVTAGADLYTTLEPCTFRGINPDGTAKISCADLIVKKKIARVVIGMLDPNPYILGNGVLQLREHGIEVGLFPHNLMAEIELANLQFRREFGLALGESGHGTDTDIGGQWTAMSTFEGGTTTREKVYLQRKIGNRYYGVMFNPELNQKYDFFMVQVAPQVWDYSFRSKRRAQNLDHGAGVIYFDSKDSARALGAAHGAFSQPGEPGVHVSVVLTRDQTQRSEA
jgi:pyrimidine deaminase RibD-like protein